MKQTGWSRLGQHVRQYTSAEDGEAMAMFEISSHLHKSSLKPEPVAGYVHSHSKADTSRLAP